MFISRYDKSTIPHRRTTGIYMHLPKFWSCKNYNFDGYWQSITKSHTFALPEFGEVTIPAEFDESDEYIVDIKRHAAERRANHVGHKFKHLSYHGYVRYIGKKHSWTFWYMGNPYRHKIIERY